MKTDKIELPEQPKETKTEKKTAGFWERFLDLFR
jgi:hypothetical protein